MGIESIPVTVLKGVGPQVANKLTRLGIHNVHDLFFHLPSRYQDRTRIVPIGSLRAGQEAVIVARIELADVVYRGRRNLICHLSDDTGHITMRLIHFSKAQQASLKKGKYLLCFGEVRAARSGLEMIHPEYEFCNEADQHAAETHLTAIYPTTEGVHQLTLRKLMRQSFDRYLPGVEECLPEPILKDLCWPALAQALQQVHYPQADSIDDELPLAQQRLAFEELLAYQLSMQRLRSRQKQQQASVSTSDSSSSKELIKHLPFKLTNAQQRVLQEIRHDLQQGTPMQRLVQGDVGSGKTIVAALAALDIIDAGSQVAVMAPTEILVGQHLKNLSHWMVPLGIEVISLTGKQSSKVRQQSLQMLHSGKARLVVGTHALFQEDVRFAKLGLIIVDEQHRFGVDQRLSLWEKGKQDNRYPHQLVMTATPIPRTLAQTLYADLDVSIIDSLPPGRKPIETVVVSGKRRGDVVQRVAAACQHGRQAYWVCPLIEESDVLELQTATDMATRLQQALPGLRVSLIHGRMKANEKERIMQDFQSGSIDVLVATTVIEVGVDVANATLMIIEHAERLGLSQLHQLRGRVGRGEEQSCCVMMYQPPLSELAQTRLAVVRETQDGFEIARRDLEIRGPGEVLGTRQTGLQNFRIADVIRDQKLLPEVQRTANRLQQEFPEHISGIIRRWLGESENYGNV